jgi:hypothetical protein
MCVQKLRCRQICVIDDGSSKKSSIFLSRLFPFSRTLLELLWSCAILETMHNSSSKNLNICNMSTSVVRTQQWGNQVFLVVTRWEEQVASLCKAMRIWCIKCMWDDTNFEIKKFIGMHAFFICFKSKNLKAFYLRFNRKQKIYMIVGH